MSDASTVYEAAANPTAVLALLDDADALRAELAHMTEARDNARAEVERLTGLVAELADPEPCSFDHNGGCQAHGFLTLRPGETCPQHDAARILDGRTES